ncbi:MAG: NADH-quinone oxidoreductase subunit N [Candidatus Thorarchaeota archaeon]
MLQDFSMIFSAIRDFFGPFTDALLTVVPAEWVASLPALTLVFFGFLALIVGFRRSPLIVSIIGVLLAGIEMLLIEPGSSFGGLFIRDAFGDFFIWIILIVAVVVLMSSSIYGGNKGTYDFLLLLSFAGAIWVVMATDLVALFLAWELMSTPTYVLVALGPHRGAIDGATKYFVMGLLSSTLIVFAIALVYGVTGATAFVAVSAYVETVWAAGTQSAYTILLAMILFLIGFGFKVGVFPGWTWVPDAYATADGSVTGYLAGATKKTGISALLRILLVAFIIARTEWIPVIIVISVLTMVIGNILALSQRNIMRMLAFSSIMMMGLLFVGMAAGSAFGASAVMFTAFAHALIKTGAFILVWALAVSIGKDVTYDDLKGLGKRAPLPAILLTILIFALAGAPFTAGFWFKWFLIPGAAVSADLWWLAIIAVLNSVFALGYYLRVLRFCFFIEPTDESRIHFPRIPLIAVILTVIGTLLIGIFPGLILDYAGQAAAVLFP